MLHTLNQKVYLMNIKNLLVICISIFLTGCGGGGSNSADSNIVFSLSKINSLTPGTLFTSGLTGTYSISSTTYPVSGTLNIANNSQTTLNGVLVTPREAYVSLTVNSTTINGTTTTYYDDFGYAIATYSSTDGVTCDATTREKLPDSIKVGDFGVLPSFSCSDGSVASTTWSAQSVSADQINLVINNITKDSGNQTTSTDTTTLTINQIGDLLQYKEEGNLITEGVQFSVSSN